MLQAIIIINCGTSHGIKIVCSGLKKAYQKCKSECVYVLNSVQFYNVLTKYGHDKLPDLMSVVGLLELDCVKKYSIYYDFCLFYFSLQCVYLQTPVKCNCTLKKVNAFDSCFKGILE